MRFADVAKVLMLALCGLSLLTAMSIGNETIQRGLEKSRGLVVDFKSKF